MEVGFYPLHIDAKMRALRNWLRISQGYCNTMIKKFFSSGDSNDCTWQLNIEALLENYGFGFISSAEEDIKISFIHKKFEIILKKKFYDEAVAKMSSSTSKMLLYACVVDNSKPFYMSKIACVNSRILFSKMRIGDHDLEVQ